MSSDVTASRSKLLIDPEVTDFYDFTVDSFRLENYEHSGKVLGIPVAI